MVKTRNSKLTLMAYISLLIFYGDMCLRHTLKFKLDITAFNKLYVNKRWRIFLRHPGGGGGVREA